jgi:hypothetical protein
MKTVKISLLSVLFLMVSFGFSFSQVVSNKEINDKITAFKNDAKGPYQQIMWFCPDGSKVPPQMRCPEPGVQRATYKKWVDDLAKSNRIYLGQILAATNFDDFLDEQHQFSRLKQYQLENYIESIDNGWIQQKAKFYRGAFQDEDENAWGEDFLKWVLLNKQLDESNFYLLRQSFKDIPHKTDNANIRKVRSLSKELADSIPSFMKLRIKIHGQPAADDIQAVKDFKVRNAAILTPATEEKFKQLIAEMETLFKAANWQSLESFIKPIGVSSDAGKSLQKTLGELSKAQTVAQKIEIGALVLLETRKNISGATPKSKMALFDLSNKTEELIFKELPNWQASTLSDILKKNYVLAMAAAGAGYIEIWEWEKIESALNPSLLTELSVGQLNESLALARGVVEWSTGMIRANYGTEIKLFEGFEPLASGFSDDIIRSSVLLHLGLSVGELGNFIASYSGLSNQVFTINNQSHFRGLNPGFAKGELVVADSPEGLEVSADKIYVFQHPPADLKPVAGIATVSEGNLVSHVQLLARNLGIPNAVLSQQNLAALKQYAGKQIFYAVSEKGTVLMKEAEKMTAEENALFETKKRVEKKIRVEVDKLDLNQKKVLSLRQVNAGSSGKICGPKAANLGQLKLMFPENVVEGLVVPFGIFRQHMEQQMPGENNSYWQFLNAAFAEATRMEKSGTSKEKIDDFVLTKLQKLREAILEMPFLTEFEADFNKQFRSVLGKETGSLPVFLRSDTNMEDLKDFTGAGLNLTLFNVSEAAKIKQGIKQVWASPYSERSFRWRQSYLLNPENVYPSILVIPTVNVDYSGVLITKGVGAGNADDLTIAFSRGAGGAVDGQAAESYRLKSTGENKLFAPSREPYYNQLPVTGGMGKLPATFETPILNQQNLAGIRDFSKKLKQKMKETNGMQGPFDVELGFLNDKLWLFQVRPFVENKNAAGSVYLESISAKTDETKIISLTEKL